MEDDDEFGGVDKPDVLDDEISAKTLRCREFAVRIDNFNNYFR
jgi:hypothetical protein